MFISILLLGCEENINERIDYLWVYQKTKKENPEFISKCNEEEYNTKKNGLTEEEAEENYTYSWGLVNNIQTDYDFKYKIVGDNVQVKETCYIKGFNQENAFRNVSFKIEKHHSEYNLKIVEKD